MIQSSINAVLIKIAALGLETKHLGKSISEMQPHFVKIVSKVFFKYVNLHFIFNFYLKQKLHYLFFDNKNINSLITKILFTERKIWSEYVWRRRRI